MKSLLKRYVEVNFLFSNILIPLIGLFLYCESFAYLALRLQLTGVNYVFASKLGKVTLVALVAAILFFIAVYMANAGNKLVFRKNLRGPALDDLILLLLPLTPVAQYVLKNQDILSPQASFNVLMIFFVFSFIYVFALPILLGTLIPVRTLMILGLAFVFTIASMASISHYFAWFGVGALKKQLPILAVTFLLIWLFYDFNSKRILHLFIALSFIVNVVTQWLPFAAAKGQVEPMEQNQLLTLIGDRRPANTPDIYLLLYDAYVHNETMLSYGIDNSAQENYLTQQGFTLYPHTYSIAPYTAATMSRVLNASTSYYGNVRRAVSGDGVVQHIVKGLGYQTYGLFPYDLLFQGIGSSYDYSIPKQILPPYLQLLKAISLGEFRFDIEDVGFLQETRDEFLHGKRQIFASDFKTPIFVYMHTDRPNHTQTSGACLPNEMDLFKERLSAANLEMQQDVDLIIQHDPGAIVIIAGDHGPHLGKNCAVTTENYDPSEISRFDIQDRYGSFLAIRWPSGDFREYDDITVLQDVFPAVFAYLYKDPTLLQAKIPPVIPLDSTINVISGVSVNNGIIVGGSDDGEPLFLSGQ